METIDRSKMADVEPLHIGTQWRRDPNHARTAIVVLELHTFGNGRVNLANHERLTETTLKVRHTERLPLETPNDAVLNRLTRIVEYLGQRTVVIADATGLGAPTNTNLIPLWFTMTSSWRWP